MTNLRTRVIRLRRSVATVTLSALFVAGLTSCTTSARDDLPTPPVATTPSAAPAPLTVKQGPPLPKHGAYLGAWVNPAVFSQPERVTSVRRFEQAIGKPLDIVHLYRRWREDFGTASDLVFARARKYLLLSWATPDSRQIVSGALDSGIRRAARQIAHLPTQVFLEPRWEMDRPNLRDLVHDPSDYVAAWNHIRAVFAAEHVWNVAWTWCPTAGGFDNGTAPAYYPGDDKVDWVCADVYPKTPWKLGSYESFPHLAKSFMTWASAHPKPIIIGEFAVDEVYGSRRAQWIREAGAYLRGHPQIKAIAWFEQSRNIDPVYHRWAVENDPPALQAFRSLVRADYFGRGG